MNPLKSIIGFRLLRYVFGGYFVIAIILTAVQLMSEYTMVKETIFIEMSALGETVEESLAKAIWNFDTEQVDSTIEGISKVAMVSGIKVLSVDEELYQPLALLRTLNSPLKPS